MTAAQPPAPAMLTTRVSALARGDWIDVSETGKVALARVLRVTRQTGQRTDVTCAVDGTRQPVTYSVSESDVVSIEHPAGRHRRPSRLGVIRQQRAAWRALAAKGRHGRPGEVAPDRDAEPVPPETGGSQAGEPDGWRPGELARITQDLAGDPYPPADGRSLAEVIGALICDSSGPAPSSGAVRAAPGRIPGRLIAVASRAGSRVRQFGRDAVANDDDMAPASS